ncbi:MAG: TonB-dependent receptor plug domain-containing protein, partial [Gallionella sp.]|nr:TonB-dependent receptor plug domain-containing protein [Gallionella sp.]
MKKHKVSCGKLFVLSCVYVSIANAAFAAEEPQLMGDVVVTATKTAKDTMDAPATVSVVTAKEIENMNIHSVDEALTLLPGVYAKRPGGHEPSVMGTNVVMRGIPDYSRTLVLVDGQTLNDPYIGAVTWESVPAETVKSIEVVPGPFSSLYGGSAMGGVINIITKTPTKREFSVKGGYGTNNFKSGSLVYQDRVGESVGIVFDYAYKQSDGYIQNEVVIKPSVGAGIAVTGAQPTTDASGNLAYLVGYKEANAWSSQNLGAKLYVDLPSESRLILGASQFLYDSSGRNRFNTYLRDVGDNPVSFGNVTFAGSRLAVGSRFLTGPDSEIKEQNRYTAEYEMKLGKEGALKATLGYTDLPMYNNYFVLKPTATLNGGPATRMLRPSNELSGSLQASLPVADRHYLVMGLSSSKRTIDTITYNVTDWR